MSTNPESIRVVVDLAPNELLIRIPVTLEYESGDWESGHAGYHYATITDFEIIADSLDENTAAHVVSEIESGDLAPDGLNDLFYRLQARFASVHEAWLERGRKAAEMDLSTFFGGMR